MLSIPLILYENPIRYWIACFQGKDQTFCCPEIQTWGKWSLLVWDRGWFCSLDFGIRISWTHLWIMPVFASEYWTSIWWYTNSKPTSLAANYRERWLQHQGKEFSKINTLLCSFLLHCLIWKFFLSVNCSGEVLLFNFLLMQEMNFCDKIIHRVQNGGKYISCLFIDLISSPRVQPHRSSNPRSSSSLSGSSQK